MLVIPLLIRVVVILGLIYQVVIIMEQSMEQLIILVMVDILILMEVMIVYHLPLVMILLLVQVILQLRHGLDLITQEMEELSLRQEKMQ